MIATARKSRRTNSAHLGEKCHYWTHYTYEHNSTPLACSEIFFLSSSHVWFWMKHTWKKHKKHGNALVQSWPTGMVILRIWQCSSAHLHRGFPFAIIAYVFNRTSEDGTRLNAGSLLLKKTKTLFLTNTTGDRNTEFIKHNTDIQIAKLITAKLFTNLT
jgi:hypothetical protein